MAQLEAFEKNKIKLYCLSKHRAIAKDLLNSIGSIKWLTESDRRKTGILDAGTLQYFVKQYIGSFAPYRVKREFKNLVTLMKQGISVTPPVGYALTCSGPILLTLYIPAARTAKEYVMAEREFNERRLFLLSVRDLITKLSRNSLYPADFHFGNLLYDDKQVYIADVNKLIRSGSNDERMKFFGNVIFSSYSLLNSTEIMKFFADFKLDLVSMRQIHFYFIERLQKYVKDRSRRAMRKGNSDFKISAGSLMSNSSQITPGLLRNGLQKAKLLKQTSSATCYQIDSHFIKQFESSRKAKKCCMNYLVAKYADLSAPQLLCFDGDVVVTRFLDRAVTLTEFVKSYYPQFSRWQKNTYIQKLLNFLKELYYKGFYHRDLKANNILYDMGFGVFYMTDIEDLVAAGNNLKVQHVLKNLSQINASLPEEVSMSDRMRLYKMMSQFILLNFNYDRALVKKIMEMTIKRGHIWPIIKSRSL